MCPVGEVQAFSSHIKKKEAIMDIVKCSEEQGLNKGQPAFPLETKITLRHKWVRLQAHRFLRIVLFNVVWEKDETLAK